MKTISAHYQGEGRCTFSVWAPQKKRMVLHLLGDNERRLDMQPAEFGYFQLEVDDIEPGTRYFFMPEGKKDFPDPASHFQPEGVHGPSEVVDHRAFQWQDSNWRGLPFKDLILYELHIGTFTPEGTFEAAISRLAELADLGVNALEIMPVNQFPGNRNWGYDGVYPYAVQSSYGGPDGLKKLVDACHAHGIAVFLDVVYNHIGPEGNYFGEYGPYFTNQYCTPWGDALNFDQHWSDGARDYFSNNPLYWFENFHIDGLRVDAIHTIYDMGAVHFWELTYHQIRQLEQKLGRSLYMIAESDLNSPRVIKTPELGGYGFTAQWLDDFHHSLYVLIDENGRDRYADFGSMEQLAKAYTDGFVHTGEFVNLRKRKYGASSVGIPGDRFVVFNQNHDQVGNRVKGERLCLLVDIERLKVATAAVMLSPYVPLLFMGEEYADESPFFYFVSHSEPELVEAVQKGRKEEFADYGFDQEPPDPQAEKTFNDSKLQWNKRTEGQHQMIWNWHKHLIHLRRTDPALLNSNKDGIRVDVLGQNGIALYRQSEDGRHRLVCLVNVTQQPVEYTFPARPDNWQKILDSKEPQWLMAENTAKLLPQEVKKDEKISLPPLSVTVYKSRKA